MAKNKKNIISKAMREPGYIPPKEQKVEYKLRKGFTADCHKCGEIFTAHSLLELDCPKCTRKRIRDLAKTVITKVDETFEIRKGNYSIMVRIGKDKSLTIGRNFSFPNGMEFVFKESKKEVVRAIGELLIKASWLSK
jgi:DNA-directed RNA polymerase subunit RPC12/RpoP